MKLLNICAWTIAIIGALNWGLIGAIDWESGRSALWHRFSRHPHRLPAGRAQRAVSDLSVSEIASRD